MGAKNDGGQAFPKAGFPYRDEGYEPPSAGMTLRDYFAAQWLTGASQFWANTEPERLATEAYRIADAMLTERAK